MNAIQDRIQHLSAALMGMDPTDLQGLADAHTQFEQIVEAAKSIPGSSAGVLAKVDTLTDDARRLLEQLILNEVKDANQHLQNVLTKLTQVQNVLAGGDVADALVPGDSIEAAFAEAPTDFARVEFSASPAAPQVEAPPRVLVEDEVPLVQEFIGEANSHLETAEQELLVIEEDPTNLESINSLFRAFHTIKGVAGFLDLRQIQALAHVTESLLDKGRSGKLELTGFASDLVLKAVDLMKVLVNAVAEAAGRTGELNLVNGVDALVKSLESFLEHGAPIDSQTPAAKQSNNTGREVEGKDVAKANEPDTKAADTEQAEAGATAAKVAGEQNVKVATDRLDRLIDMVGELVIANSMVAQDVAELAQKDVRVGRHLSHQGKIVRELQDLSMSLRMVQVGNVFKKMTRLVRDTARKAVKEVDLKIEGGETELDRNVVEALADPLVHMVRNAVDHGIEPADQREAAGKPRAGTLTLRAFHKGGNINIEIVDDGRGLNRDKILKKAIANGLVREDQAITDAEIYKLIFAAGLSTADKLTDISGRGVGMDVVKQNIEKLRGRVDITTQLGRGSTFTIRLPLTLAVIDGLVVKVGQQKYILPITSIEQSIRPTPEMLSTVQGQGEIVSVRGSILPLMRLHRIFNIEPRTTNPAEALTVIVQDNDRRVAVLVDELLGQEQVVIKSLGEGLGNTPGISGGAVLGDGNVSLILDVPGLIDLAHSDSHF